MYIKTAKTHHDTFKDQETLSMIDMHYIYNKYFIKPRQIVNPKNIKKIEHIPTIFVHGRLDIRCPLQMAYEMNKKLKDSELVIVDGGHTYHETEIADAMIKGLNKLGKRLYPSQYKRLISRK